MVKTFIAPKGALWAVTFFASLIAGLQLVIGQELHSRQVIKKDVVCSVEKIGGKYDVSLDLNCGGLKASTKDASAILAYFKSPKVNLTCTVRNGGKADCDNPKE